MRGPTAWTAKQKAEEMERVARMLGLESVLDTQIGTPVERGLSGGETKRVSIANELLARPSLLFADEPLTGLDSTRAVQARAPRPSRRWRTRIAETRPQAHVHLLRKSGAAPHLCGWL